jgi:hypothetical protein
MNNMVEESEIREVIESFADAAKRAEEAGADAVQLHCAHGFLINEFLSPFFNDQHDGWGGSDEGRFRFLGGSLGSLFSYSMMRKLMRLLVSPVTNVLLLFFQYTFPELAFSNHLFQVSVCHCDDSDIHGDGFRAPDPLELLLLYHP